MSCCSSNTHETIHEIPSKTPLTHKQQTSHKVNASNIPKPPTTYTQEQYNVLNAEINRLSTLCKNLSNETDNLKLTQDAHLLEIDALRARIIESKSYESKSNNELRGKLSILVSENERLNRTIVDKNKEIESYKLRYSQLHQDREEVNYSLNERLKETNFLRARVSELENSGAKTHMELREKISLLASENEKLNSFYAEGLKEINNLRAHTFEIEKNHRQDTDTQTKLSLLMTENHRLHDIAFERSKEIESLKARLAHSHEWEDKYAPLRQERDRLCSILAERVKEINSLQSRVIELEKNGANSNNELKGRVALLASENDRLSHLLLEKIKITQEWETKYSTLETLYMKVKKSVDSLEDVKRNLAQSIEHIERKETYLRQSQDETTKRSPNSYRYHNVSGVSTNSGSPVAKAGYNSARNHYYYI